MKHCVKNLYDFSKPNSVPEFIGQRETLTCPKCQQQIVVAVPPECVDYQKLYEEQRSYAQQMWMECNLLLSAAGVDTLLEAQLKKILERCRRNLGIDTQFP